MEFFNISPTQEQQLPVSCCNVSPSHWQTSVTLPPPLPQTSVTLPEGAVLGVFASAKHWLCHTWRKLPTASQKSNPCYQSHANLMQLLTPKCLTAVIFIKTKTRRQTFWRDSLSYSIGKRISKDTQKICSLKFTLHFSFADCWSFSSEVVAFKNVVKFG